MGDIRDLTWEDHPSNPLIKPPGREFIIADPTIVSSADSPDKKVHLFAHSLRGIHHYVSYDGVKFERLAGPLFRGLRPYVVVENGYHMFYERFVPLRKTVIAVRSSPDLIKWSEPRTVVSPLYPWEGRGLLTNSNPCVVPIDGGYRLYFAASWIFLKDCKFIEPKVIGYAESKMLLGPYEKHPEPIIVPSPDLPWRNFGAGSIKVMPPQGNTPWIALNNGIYLDDQGRSRSEIRMLESDDGLAWTEVHEKPILAPEPGWKNALVYAMHLYFHEGVPYIYYNARDGWFKGTERIGLAIGK